jgi:hypothetical protein
MDVSEAPQIGHRHPTIVCVIGIPSTRQTGTDEGGGGTSVGMDTACMPHLTSIRTHGMKGPRRPCQAAHTRPAVRLHHGGVGGGP